MLYTCAGSGSGLGFCRNYSFNTGDLTTCGDVLINYLEAYEHIPWDDLRYVSAYTVLAGSAASSWLYALTS
jgi:dynein heavy chain